MKEMRKFAVAENRAHLFDEVGTCAMLNMLCAAVLPCADSHHLMDMIYVHIPTMHIVCMPSCASENLLDKLL